MEEDHTGRRRGRPVTRRHGRGARWTRPVLVATTVALVLAVAALWAPASTRPARSDRPPAAAPAGTRWVGVGHAVIAVPREWATNALRCGTPTAPTVVVDVSVVEACGRLSPKVHESVWLEAAHPADLRPVEELEIDGVPASRGTISCSPRGELPRRCSGTVVVPSESASFRAEAGSRRRVAEILTWVRVVRDRVAVPGFGPSDTDHQADDAGEHYRGLLAAAGLDVAVVTERRPGTPAGYVLDVRPGPGTMLEPGAVVTMTEVADPRGPADEVSVAVNSVGPGDSMDYRGLDDAQVRAGAAIRIGLGSTIWVHGYGRRIGTLAGYVSGPALSLDDWKEGPNYGRSWKAVARGTSTLRITIRANGRRVPLGTVTVAVR